MGSKKAWGAAIGAAVGTVVAPGIGTAAGAAAGGAVGKKMDDKDKKKSSGGRASAVDYDKGTSTGGEDPFADTTAAKKKKVNTLLAGSNVGALSGAGSSQGALTLGS